MPMKIIVLGGYGIFGGRLCHLLAGDARIALFVAGRNLRSAQEFCRTLPAGAQCAPLLFDRDGDLPRQLQQLQPDLLIDASGPFQSYGADPYRLVKACLDHGVNYMDFADGSDFVKGIHQFDERAKRKNLFALSGVSSFPVLTAAVVRHLARDLREVNAIRGGIAPSPFAVVGLNVMRAISAYAGKPVNLTRHGRHTTAYALTEGMRYTVSPPGRLPLNNVYFSLVDVPDLQVLPELWPELHDVWMGAGPVPEMLHRLLNALAWLVRLRLLPSLKPFAWLFLHAQAILRWGEHRGGMFVEIDGVGQDDECVTRSWHLLAEGDDGPFIPCLALEALVQRTLDGKIPAAGARPASKDLELDDYDSLFKRRTIYTGQREAALDNSSTSIFKTLLGNAWADLPAPIRKAHDAPGDVRLTGVATVERGKGVLAGVIARLIGFPPAGDGIPVEVLMTKCGKHETWRRTFGGRSFSSVLSAGEGRADKLLSERFGPLSFDIALVVDNGKLHYIVRNWQFLRLPLPRSWAPRGESYESSKNGAFGFDIEIRHPLAGLIVNYAGGLAIEKSDADVGIL
jgi:hypothetical protein